MSLDNGSSPDRRAAIADAAIAVIAADGVRALTHRALDRRLGLPPGSVSYYHRTRKALLEAVVRELAARNRADFVASGQGFSAPAPAPAPGPGADSVTSGPGARRDDLAVAVRGMAVLVDRMIGVRRADSVARYALTLELAADPDLRDLLATPFFAHGAAADLLAGCGVADPAGAADDLISLVDGLVFDRCVGRRARTAPAAGTAASIDELARALHTFVLGCLRWPHDR
ncbi:TetR family transcriptional regulator [Rhodococcus sp. D2-41]|uniref:TetR/AcrR family transcriptional regulator n=1 Tax=Speluncibacter jeojiensis TaxID=2710754 RepID=UPI00240FB7DC|nr:TetR family transcriptional regulator [Rhodococcus sp. D2-41]MDG3012540.1 TetR family transcriptional regulator [Rhodococcus sp. D2-41]